MEIRSKRLHDCALETKQCKAYMSNFKKRIVMGN
uniref:Uncharacterized protein n=1 Tax=Rhizophora mucronata TaxID=61149 RepID=A0A2P2QZY3_RHIMU